MPPGGRSAAAGPPAFGDAPQRMAPRPFVKKMDATAAQPQRGGDKLEGGVTAPRAGPELEPISQSHQLS